MAEAADLGWPAELDQWNGHLRDRGPIYTETLYHHAAYEANNWHVVEPCNAITASVFIFIVGFWLIRLRGQYRRHPFVLAGMVILLVGGVGGTIYHAFRQWPVFLYMDFGPIALLSLMAAIYLCARLRLQWYLVVLAIFGIVLLNFFLFLLDLAGQVRILVGYLLLAVLIVTPLALVLIRTRGRHSQWIKLGVVSFAFAILFRYLDPVLSTLPTGTHFLWHLGGAATTYCLIEYFSRIEIEPLAASPVQAFAAQPV
ncbi:MAG TPA: hypothetical protein VGZ47_21555 [Gemmataceae bacterium]|jgi:hemolysin III|nr:hypothetical protein [Gemmataceae bacterium]